MLRSVGHRYVRLQGRKAFITANTGKVRANSPAVPVGLVNACIKRGFLTEAGWDLEGEDVEGAVLYIVSETGAVARRQRLTD